MYRILKQEHNEAVPKRYGLAEVLDVIPGIIRNWLHSQADHARLMYEADCGPLFPYATVHFHGGLSVKWFVEKIAL